MIPNLPPRLTPDEQADVTRRMVAARDAIRAGDDSAETEREFLKASNALALDQVPFCLGLARKQTAVAMGLVEADDVAQEAFVNSLRGIRSHDPGRSERPYVIGNLKARYGVVEFIGPELKYRRRFDANGFACEVADKSADYDSHPETTDLLGATLDKIAPEHAEVLRLRHGIGTGRPLDFDEIGQRFAISREAACWLYRKALNSARAGWYEPEPLKPDPPKFEAREPSQKGRYRFRPERCPWLRTAIKNSRTGMIPRPSRAREAILHALEARPSGATPGEVSMFSGGAALCAAERDAAFKELVTLGSIEEITVPAYRTGRPVKAYRLTQSQIARQEIP